jgi:hypothetical protein
MGTTLTAAYVGEQEVALAHVGDSRAYCLRDGELLRLTDDHSLVDELMRQGRLTPEEAVEHPQRSVITRALGPEGTVEVDTRSFRARAGDVYLLCSDGLTTMISEELIAATLIAHPRLHDAGEALIAAANQAGGRDNITVVLIRLEDVQLADVRGGERRAHARLLGVRVRELVDAGVGGARERGELQLRVRRVRKPRLEGLDRDPRGDLAGLRPAHAVGDDEQRRAREQRVLVGAPLAPGVGAGVLLGDAQHQSTSKVNSLSPMRTLSPGCRGLGVCSSSSLR